VCSFMEYYQSDLLTTLGSSARIWAQSGRHEVHPEWWIALSGQSNVGMNMACCQSSNPAVLKEHCLQQILENAKPGIILLGGPGLSTAQSLVDVGWVTVNAMPLMLLTSPPATGPDKSSVDLLTLDELPLARKLLADTLALDAAGAEALLPDSVIGSNDKWAWGLKEAGQLISTVTIVREGDLAVVWSMATRSESRGRGHGRRLLEVVLHDQFDSGAQGSLLHSSKAGESLYRSLGYSVVEYLQLWSRPRWVLGSA
jgi:ribosomal protein S18 acetylase RimI-like enzyme